VGKCFDCDIEGKPFSIFDPELCDVCADWTVFEAMCDAYWYVDEKSARTSYNMDLCAWYKAVDEDGVPLGYRKPHDTYYPPYDTQSTPVIEALTEKPASATLSRSVQKRLAVQRPSTTGTIDIVPMKGM